MASAVRSSIGERGPQAIGDALPIRRDGRTAIDGSLRIGRGLPHARGDSFRKRKRARTSIRDSIAFFGEAREAMGDSDRTAGHPAEVLGDVDVIDRSLPRALGDANRISADLPETRRDSARISRDLPREQKDHEATQLALRQAETLVTRRTARPRNHRRRKRHIMENVITTLSKPAALHDATNEPATRQAAERLAAEMATVAESDMERVSFDVAAGVTRMLGFWEVFSTYLPTIAKLEGIDIERVGKLREYALNLLFWQGSATYAAAPRDGLPEIIERGIALRDTTLSDLQSLANHGIIDPVLLENFRGTKEHRKLGQDLIGLSNLVHEHWPVIEGKSPITLTAMDEVARHGEVIMQIVGERERAPMTIAEKVLQRDKAYTLFVRAYDEARRAILYLRWKEEDADMILPSLHKGRRGKRKVESEDGGVVDGSASSGAASVLGGGQASSLLVDGDEDDDVEA